MSFKNPRINVTFEETTADFLSYLAKQEHTSVAGLVRELTLDALEMREDLYLSKMAKNLDKKGAKTRGHDEAWE